MDSCLEDIANCPANCPAIFQAKINIEESACWQHRNLATPVMLVY